MKNRNEKRHEIVYTVLFCLFAVVFLLGFGIIAYHVISAFRSTTLNDELQKQFFESSLITSQNADADLTSEDQSRQEASVESPGSAGQEAKGEKQHRQLSLDFKELKSSYPDTAAWLTLEALRINYPVMHTDNNSFYIDHLYNGEPNSYGALFVDYRNRGDFSDQNTVIYGHHMRDGSMFGSLEDYRSQEFYDLYPTMMLYTPEGDYRIEFISGTSEDGDYEFVEFNFNSEEAFLDYVQDLRSRSCFTSDVEVHPGDRLVSLCTCAYKRENERFMLVGKLVELYTEENGPGNETAQADN